jgi:hypothetical protein
MRKGWVAEGARCSEKQARENEKERERKTKTTTTDKLENPATRFDHPGLPKARSVGSKGSGTQSHRQQGGLRVGDVTGPMKIVTAGQSAGREIEVDCRVSRSSQKRWGPSVDRESKPERSSRTREIEVDRKTGQGPRRELRGRVVGGQVRE